jgi:hypothetical protein
MYYVHPADLAGFCRGMRSVSVCGTGYFTARLRVVRAGVLGCHPVRYFLQIGRQSIIGTAMPILS